MRILCLILLVSLLNFSSASAYEKPATINKLDQVLPILATRPDSAFYLVKTVYLQAQKEANQNLEAACALALGEVLYYLGDYDNANQYLLEAIEKFELLDDMPQLAESYKWQGVVTQYSRQYEMALSSYRKSLKIQENLGNDQKSAELFGWIGHYFEKTGNIDSALFYQYKAKSILSNEESGVAMAQIYGNLGSLHEDLGSYDSANYYFTRSLAVNRLYGELNNEIVNLNNLGDVWRKQGDYDKALHYIDTAMHKAVESNIAYQVRAAHRDYSKIYLELKDFQKAFEHLEEAYNIYTDIINEENNLRIALLQTVYESERKENRITLLEKDKHLDRWYRYASLSAFLIFISIAALINRNQRFKIKKNREILAQQKVLNQKQDDLSKMELKNALLNEDKLRAEIEHQKLKENELHKNIVLKSQLITSHTLQIIRKNKFLQQLSQELHNLKKSEKKERSEAISAMIKSINQDITDDENWDDFNMVFGQVHQDFFSNLKNLYPDISTTELRLASLLKLNLHSGEIATILGISTDSLRIAKYRLKKKVNLKKNDDLHGFLMNI